MTPTTATTLRRIALGALTACVLGSLLLLSACSMGAPTDTVTDGEAGRKAPQFSFEELQADNTLVTRDISELEGKTVVMTFWASWCGACRKEMSLLHEFVQANDDVVSLAVNISDKPETVGKIAQETGYDFIWALDTDGTISSLYPSQGIPYTVILAPDGSLVRSLIGVAPDQEQRLEEAVDIARSRA